MQDPAVANVDLGGLDQALADVGEPGRQPADQHQVRQEVHVTRHRGHRDIEAAGKLRGVQETALAVAEHRPEAPQGFGWHAHAELRDVALQIRANEVEPPAGARCIAPGGKGVGKAAAEPKGVVIGPDFQSVQPRQLVIDDAAGERLRRLPQQGIRSRPEEKKVPRTPAAAAALVNLSAQHSKEIGHPLDLVQDHQPVGMELEIPRTGSARRAAVPWILEIEVQAVGGFSRDCAGERGLPDLRRGPRRATAWNLFEKLQKTRRVCLRSIIIANLTSLVKLAMEMADRRWVGRMRKHFAQPGKGRAGCRRGRRPLCTCAGARTSARTPLRSGSIGRAPHGAGTSIFQDTLAARSTESRPFSPTSREAAWHCEDKALRVSRAPPCHRSRTVEERGLTRSCSAAPEVP